MEQHTTREAQQLGVQFQWRINREGMEARASDPTTHSDSVQIFEVINLYNRTV